MKLTLAELMGMTFEPKFKEGQRVMLIPKDEEEANAGWEQPEGTVLCPGKHTLVLWDEEFRGGGSGLEDVDEERLLLIDSLPSMLLRRQAG